MSIPVICDRCRSTGVAGQADFSNLGDLLEFEPVPRRPRVNGWDAEAQRAFIALLAVTGSKRRAALAIGRNAFGVDQLLKAKGNEGFTAAYDRALAIARGNGAMKLAQGVADAVARNARMTPPSRLRDDPPELDTTKEDAASVLGSAWLDRLMRSYLLKVGQERTARLAGDVVAADFYVRQLTWLEVVLDICSDEGLFDAFSSVRLRSADGGWSVGLIQVAETSSSAVLDDARRCYWEQCGEPERPPPPPQETLRHAEMIAPGGRRLTIGLQPSHFSGADLDEQMRQRDANHRRWAQEQVEWESRQRADWLASQSVRGTDEDGSGPAEHK